MKDLTVGIRYLHHIQIAQWNNYKKRSNMGKNHRYLYNKQLNTLI